MANVLTHLKDFARFAGIMTVGACVVIGLVTGFLFGGLFLVILGIGCLVYILAVDPPKD